MIDVAALLPKLLDLTNGNPEVTETLVKLAWQRAAGAGLRLHAVPFRLYRQTLVVSVSDAIWQRQLQQMSAEFIFRINKLLGCLVLKDIEFRVHPEPVAQVRAGLPARSSQRPALEPTAEILSAAGSISDADLRERFIRAAANCIARRKAHAAN